MTDDVSQIRTDYRGEPLDLSATLADPIEQFRTWMDAAVHAAIPDANAMTLATVANGEPRARIVLLKGIEPDGFVFYTNYNSAKGEELAASPAASLVFFWQPLARQVRVAGRCERVEGALSDAYFATRPRESQIGAWASTQSAAVASRDALDAEFKAAEARFPEAVPRPPHWGGYRLRPERIEFWQGRPARLHDRIVYTREEDGGWSRQRLAP